MRVVWETEDVHEHLGDVVTTGADGEHWILAYEGGVSSTDAKAKRYRLCSLRDGMLTDPKSAEQMAHALNAGRKRILSRPVRAEEAVKA